MYIPSDFTLRNCSFPQHKEFRRFVFFSKQIAICISIRDMKNLGLIKVRINFKLLRYQFRNAVIFCDRPHWSRFFRNFPQSYMKCRVGNQFPPFTVYFLCSPLHTDVRSLPQRNHHNANHYRLCQSLFSLVNTFKKFTFTRFYLLLAHVFYLAFNLPLLVRQVNLPIIFYIPS